jgi:type IV/VI secretion system ImpK/VasF family protein
VSASSLDSLFHPLLALATAIADDPASRPHPQQLRYTIDTLVATAARESAAASIPEPDYRAALYATVAFLDELLGAHYHPHEWQPAALALHYFEDNNAGVGFFTRLEQLIVEQRWSVVRIYYLVLGLGFAGQYAFGDRSGLVAHRRRLAQLMGIGIALVPLAAPESRLAKQRPKWYAFAPLGLAAASVVALVVVIVTH